jgi:Holin of 3TMs, for gene-transfer release
MSKGRDDWMQTLWRPMMGWMYMLICLLDMAVFPVLWALWQGMNHVPITQWNPLTLQGAGLFHIAMGAVLGIAAFGRTQEKLAGTAANPTATSQTMTNNTNMSGMAAGGMGGMNNGMGSGFGGSSGGFGSTPSFGSAPLGSNSMSTAPAFGSTPAPAFGSTPAPAFGTPAPACPNTGKPLGPAQSFPAL